jgi:hypothetical protein
MRQISKLRFKNEPTGLRGVVNSGMLNAGGPAKWDLQLDESTGIVYLRAAPEGSKAIPFERALHISDCAWIEFLAAPAPPKEPAVKK